MSQLPDQAAEPIPLTAVEIEILARWQAELRLAQQRTEDSQRAMNDLLRAVLARAGADPTRLYVVRDGALRPQEG